jgi:beta-mannosidase
MFFRILFALFLLANSFSLSGKTITELNSGWKFKEAYQPSQYLPAVVPGTIHTDLLVNKLIPDPFIGTNENKVQWVETKTWEYVTEFVCDKTVLKEKHIELTFEGLDTYAKVYLNDSLILTSKNMFVASTIDVKKLIKAKNKLKIIFLPASQLIEENRKAAGNIEYPGGDRVYIRKAQYQFGWDWGPRMVTCGIWKPIKLVAHSERLLISDVCYTTEELKGSTASVNLAFTLKGTDANKPFLITVSDGSAIYVKESESYSLDNEGNVLLHFEIKNPRLWWSNGYGKPELYRFILTVQRDNYSVSDTTLAGIRKIRVATNNDNSTPTFRFELNDVPIFVKGCNWIPQDNFIPRVTESKTLSQLRDMQQLNMNMVRVWGGGVYESEHFYSLCDSLGLMVWQDLMFACSMYPYGVHNKFSSLEDEVLQMFKRAEKHCSVVMMCGDNENYEGWTNWGWQKQFGYSKETEDQIYDDYINFNSHINGLIAKNNWDSYAYWSSSPKNGWGRKEAYLEGDVHYWGVWWGNEPFSAYETHVGRFVSEYGFQSCPSIHTFEEMGADVSNWLNDSVIRQHQKHPTGYQTISNYMQRDYGVDSLSGEYYIYFSQVLQRDAMRTAVEAHRRAMPYCMGSLFWQYNDCWPVTSWSVEDYYGRKKMAWHELKRLYAPLMTSVWSNSDSVFVSIISEYESPISGELVFEWNDFRGKSLYEKIKRIELPVTSSEICFRISKTELQKLLPLNEGYVRAQFIPDNQNKYTNTEAVVTLCKYSEMKLPAPEYSFTTTANNSGEERYFTFTSKVYMKDVMFSFNDPQSEFSMSGFDALPGVNYTVMLRSKQKITSMARSIRVTSAYDIVQTQH